MSQESMEQSAFIQRSVSVVVMVIMVKGCVLAPSSTSEQTLYDQWIRFIALLLCWILLALNLLRLNVQDWIEREKMK
jgi:hypothetical protein